MSIVQLTVNRLSKLLTIFVLGLGFSFQSALASDICTDLFRNDTQSSTEKSEKSTNSSRGRGRSDYSDFASGAIIHIFDGNFAEGRFVGGMHLLKGLINIFTWNKKIWVNFNEFPRGEIFDRLNDVVHRYPRQSNLPSDVAHIRIAENGVIFLELPYFILSSKLQNTIPKARSIVEPNLKTLFPLTWSKEFIISTAREILANATVKEIADRTIVRTVEGVNVVVRLDENGKIGSTFPSHKQPRVRDANEIFADHQKNTIEEFFVRKKAESMEKELVELLADEIKLSQRPYPTEDWFRSLPPELKTRVVRKFRNTWLITHPDTILEGFSQGFSNSERIVHHLNRHFGAISFRDRLNQERQSIQPSQIKQRARNLLISFGMNSSNPAHLENVVQFLQNRIDYFTPELIEALNRAAEKSLGLYYRQPRGNETQAERFTDDVQNSWPSILFIDLQR